MARTLCDDCIFSVESGLICALNGAWEAIDKGDECFQEDEVLQEAAAQIAALQRERELERLPEQQRQMGRAHAAEAFGGEVEE